MRTLLERPDSFRVAGGGPGCASHVISASAMVCCWKQTHPHPQSSRQRSAALLLAYCTVLSLTINLPYNFLHSTFLSQRICQVIHLIPAEQSPNLSHSHPSLSPLSYNLTGGASRPGLHLSLLLHRPRPSRATGAAASLAGGKDEARPPVTCDTKSLRPQTAAPIAAPRPPEHAAVREHGSTSVPAKVGLELARQQQPHHLRPHGSCEPLTS